MKTNKEKLEMAQESAKILYLGLLNIETTEEIVCDYYLTDIAKRITEAEELLIKLNRATKK